MAIGMSFSISSKFSINNRKGMTTYFPSIIIVIYKATNMNWTKSLRDGLPRLWHSDFLLSITKSSGKQVLKVVLLSHHNETIKQDRPSRCLWKEYHPSAWLASGFTTQMHLRVKQCFDYYWFYIEDFIMKTLDFCSFCTENPV